MAEKKKTRFLCQYSDLNAQRVRSLAFLKLKELKNYMPPRYGVKKYESSIAGVFGIPLHMIVQQDSTVTNGLEVPTFIHEIISVLEASDAHKVGLFRVPGSVSRIQDYIRQINRKIPVDFSDVLPNDLAGLLKHFLKELPHLLIPLDTVYYFLEAYSTPYAKYQENALDSDNGPSKLKKSFTAPVNFRKSETNINNSNNNSTSQMKTSVTQQFSDRTTDRLLCEGDNNNNNNNDRNNKNSNIDNSGKGNNGNNDDESNDISTMNEKEYRRYLLNLIMLTLPKVEHHFLVYFIQFLSRMAFDGSTNMNCASLATCLAPTLFRVPSDFALSNVLQINLVLAELLEIGPELGRVPWELAKHLHDYKPELYDDVRIILMPTKSIKENKTSEKTELARAPSKQKATMKGNSKPYNPPSSIASTVIEVENNFQQYNRHVNKRNSSSQAQTQGNTTTTNNSNSKFSDISRRGSTQSSKSNKSTKSNKSNKSNKSKRDENDNNVNDENVPSAGHPSMPQRRKSWTESISKLASPRLRRASSNLGQRITSPFTSRKERKTAPFGHQSPSENESVEEIFRSNGEQPSTEHFSHSEQLW